DLVTEHIKLVIGEEWDLRKRHSQTAASRTIVPDRDGILDWIDGSRAAALPGVLQVEMYVKPESPIVRKGDYRDYIGRVVASSPSLAQTKAILQHAVDLVGWSITPFPPLANEEKSAAPHPTEIAPGNR
ncbi:MAG: hypothetical protein EOR33_33935, partial [Mesorhizobium sp.]